MGIYDKWASLKPEKRLWLAVLNSAAGVIQGKIRATVEEIRLDGDWLQRTDEYPPPHSFEWICGVLKLDPVETREAIRSGKYWVEGKVK